MNTFKNTTLKQAITWSCAGLFLLAIASTTAKLSQEIKETAKEHEKPVDANGLTAEMKHNMVVCDKAGLLYLPKFTALGYKSECMTRFEYDRRLRNIDIWVANSKLQ